MVNLAGGGSRFKYNAAHAEYIWDAFDGGSGLYNSANSTSTCPPKPGDLVCSGRLSQAGWTFQDFQNWYDTGSYSFISSHCDIVVAVTDATQVTTIGGNLGNTTLERTFTKANYESQYAVRLRLGGRPGMLDVVFCTDISGSFADDIANFQAQVPEIICGEFGSSDLVFLA